MGRGVAAAWDSYYSPEHIRTILRRVAANPKGRPGTTLSTLLWFKLMHPTKAFTRSKAAHSG